MQTQQAGRFSSQRLRVIFMGTAALARPTLEALGSAPSIKLVGIVTQPDRPRGRKLQLRPGPISGSLAAAGVPVWMPERVNDPDLVAILRRAVPDAIVVMAYGQFLKQDLLDLPSLGCINVHLSLLPGYRGAAPVQWALAKGEKATGITIMRMNLRMDAGDILSQQSHDIRSDDTAVALGQRLAEVAPPLLLATLAGLAEGSIEPRPQDEARATYAPLLRKSDGRIDWNMSAREIEQCLRAFTPWPGCYCTTPAPRAGRLKIVDAAVESVPAFAGECRAPGTVLAVAGQGPLVATGREALRLLAVQPEGRRLMSGQAYIRGHRWRTGDRLS